MAESASSVAPESGSDLSRTTSPRIEGDDWFQLSALAASGTESGAYSAFPALVLEQTSNPSPRPTNVEPDTAETAADFLPRIDGYEVLSVLGRGGMGMVFKARQTGLNRIVALKMIKPGSAAFTEDLARFRAEAQAVASLQHPNIVQIYEIGKFKDSPFFSLEYVDGGTLQRRLAAQPQDPTSAARLVTTLARAMHAAHERGIVHRDLKPSNILMMADGTPKLSDFSLALHVPGDPRLTETGQVRGTPNYMAPEQASRQHAQIGPAADIHALGAILYEMLTGHPPYQGVSLCDTILRVLRFEPLAPRRLQPGIPKDLETACLQCLQKEPERRYATAAALADDLDRFVAGKPIRARRTTAVGKLARWSRRKPREAALGVGIGLVAACLGMGLTWTLWKQAANHERIAGDIRTKMQIAEQDQARAHYTGPADPRLWKKAHDSALDVQSLISGQSSFSQERARLERMLREIDDGFRAAEVRRDDLDRQHRVTDHLATLRLHDNPRRYDRAACLALCRGFAELFRECGIDPSASNAADTVMKVRASALQDELIGILIEWAALGGPADADDAKRTAVLQAVLTFDHNVWRQKLAKALSVGDGRAMAETVKFWTAETEPPTVTLAFARALHSCGFLGESTTVLHLALQRSPDDFWLNHQLGWALHHGTRPRIDEALGYYRAARVSRPDLSGVWVNLGLALVERGEFEEALRLHQQATARDHSSPHGHYGLGVTFAAMGRLDDALKEFQLAIHAEPKFLSAWMGIGSVRLRQKHFDEAIRAYQNAQQDHPESPRVRHALGHAYFECGNFDKAIDTFRKAIELAPDWASPHHDLGVALRLANQAKEAESSFADAVRLGPDEPQFRISHGAVLVDLGQDDAALAELLAAVSLQSNESQASILLSRILERNNRSAEAENWLREAVRRKPYDPISHFVLGNYLREKKRSGEAAAAYSQAVHLFILDGGFRLSDFAAFK